MQEYSELLLYTVEIRETVLFSEHPVELANHLNMIRHMVMPLYFNSAVDTQPLLTIQRFAATPVQNARLFINFGRLFSAERLRI